MKLLGNSSRGITPLQKWLLYRCYVLLIALYGFQLWFYNYAPLSYSLKALGKMQRRAAIFIIGTFKISPIKGIEALVGLIPIKSHLQKLGGRLQLHIMSLPTNHIIWMLMDSPFGSPHYQHPSSLNSFTDQQRASIKGHLVNSNNRSYGMFPPFSPLHPKLSLGFRIIDSFSDWFSFNLFNKGKNDKLHLQQLNSMVIELSLLQSIAIIAMDASIKNDIAIFISHIHISNHPLTKTLHHTAFVTSSEAELFTIRCDINQASSKENISKIIVITNSIHVAKKIFDPLSHLLQIHTVAILEKLCQFFSRNSNNLIEFWECPSRFNWHPHKTVDLEIKASNPSPVYPCKTLWDYSKKTECDNILNNCKMTFQASDGIGNQFLNLLDDNFNIIEPFYAKGGPWLQAFSHSNLLCVCTSRAITNHTPIGEYRLRFFPREEFKCLCGLYPIKSWRHILHDCRRFNGYWNPRWDSLSHFVMFLKANPNTFAFIDNPYSTSESRSHS